MTRLTVEGLARLDAQAALEGTTRGQLMRQVLERYLFPPDDLVETVQRLEELRARTVADTSEAQELTDRLLCLHVQAPLMAQGGGT